MDLARRPLKPVTAATECQAQAAAAGGGCQHIEHGIISVSRATRAVTAVPEPGANHLLELDHRFQFPHRSSKTACSGKGTARPTVLLRLVP